MEASEPREESTESEEKASGSRRFPKPPRKSVILMHDIMYRKTKSLARVFIGVVGGKLVGRRTLLRRFSDMKAGPLPPADRAREKPHFVLMTLDERPYLHGRGMICMYFSLVNPRDVVIENLYRRFSRFNACVMLFDLSRGCTADCIINFMIDLAYLMPRSAPRYILAGNKNDLQREVSVECLMELAAMCKPERYYECSALVNNNMDAVLDALLVMALNQNLPLP